MYFSSKCSSHPYRETRRCCFLSLSPPFFCICSIHLPWSHRECTWIARNIIQAWDLNLFFSHRFTLLSLFDEAVAPLRAHSCIGWRRSTQNFPFWIHPNRPWRLVGPRTVCARSLPSSRGYIWKFYPYYLFTGLVETLNRLFVKIWGHCSLVPTKHQKQNAANHLEFNDAY